MIQRFLQKLKIELSDDPAVLLLAYIWRKLQLKKIHAKKKKIHAALISVYSSTIYNSQDMEDMEAT